ncbi:MAG: YggS family pyridoxal phosphate-dependent enzyme [Lactobacillales bacterium]|jgi:pyridoxal phosphate enzyme (YggS family)|nr:YggS family pyridoxal phosphate-dependent enzyme [Lactobacillales bacterium]
MDLEKNIAKVQEKIVKCVKDAGRKVEDIHLIAVTKYFGVEINEQLYDLGLREFGENRADIFLNKVEKLKGHQDIIWHFIGNLQRRKVKQVINKIDYFHALDSLALAAEIEKRAEQKVKCFVEVNISGEESKHGFKADEVKTFIAELKNFNKIEVVGLLTMAPLSASQEELHQYFGHLKTLQEKISSLQIVYAPCTEVSMGMSQDFEIALLEKASYIRVGTALYS